MDGPAEGNPNAALSDYLAAERTLLAWIRTGLALMGFGFVVARFGLFLQELQAASENHLDPSVRPLAVVWHCADRSGSDRKFICGMAACAIGPALDRGGVVRPRPAAPAVAIAIVPGIGRVGDDELSDFSAQFGACNARKHFREQGGDTHDINGAHGRQRNHQ